MRRTLIWSVTLGLMLAATAARAGWEQGMAAFTSKNYQAAVNEFQELVEQNPDSYQGHFMLGLSLEQLKRKEEALHHLRTAYDLNPRHLSVKFALGRAYFNVRRYGEVTKLLNAVDPSALPGTQQVAFYQIRGHAKLKSGDGPGALGDFARLAELRPTHAPTQYLYGTMALNHGQLDVGIAALGRASQLAAGDAKMKRAYTQALFKKGLLSQDRAAKKESYLKAAGLAKELVSAAPSYDHLILKISAELGAGLYADATETGKAAIARQEADWLAHYYLGQAYTGNRQYQEAEGPLRTALEKASKPEDMKLVWRQLGDTFEKQKRFSESIKAYQSAGDTAAVARVRENEETERYNRQIEAENKRIREMEEEERKIREQLKALEEGKPPTE